MVKTNEAETEADDIWDNLWMLKQLWMEMAGEEWDRGLIYAAAEVANMKTTQWAEIDMLSGPGCLQREN